MSHLETLTLEINAYDKALHSLESLYQELEDLLAELRHWESVLEADATATPDLTPATSKWYKLSIQGLKRYNPAINRFNKNVVSNPKFKADVDDAYIYKLPMANHPQPPPKLLLVPLAPEKLHYENKLELTKAIVLHLLKNGHCEVVQDLLDEVVDGGGGPVNDEALARFRDLKHILDSITKHHNLALALDWFAQYSLNSDRSWCIGFKFHVLQYVLLLNQPDKLAMANAAEASAYAQRHFPHYSKRYFHEIAMLAPLLVYQREHATNFFAYLHKSHLVRLLLNLSPELTFVVDLLDRFQQVHDYEEVFVNLAHEFMLEFCEQLGLSDDSLLFQAVLAGFVYMPLFYKYNQIQTKLGKTPLEPDSSQFVTNLKGETVAAYTYDLPFQLSDAPRFLWRYHPIFICPISKEQLIPITGESAAAGGNGQPHDNPVVVLDHCQHVALKDSVWQLLKKGVDMFKCHYCYKKHKMSEVKDAYFIDL